MVLKCHWSFLRLPDSCVSGSYWPTNGIKMTPYSTWLQQAETAGHQVCFAASLQLDEISAPQVVHAPLSATACKNFNVKAAWEFFLSQKGLNYGFGTLLTGWIDTPQDNFPCLPPYDAPKTEQYCLTWELIETLFPLLAKKVPVVRTIFLEAWNHRVGVHATGPNCEGCLDAAEVRLDLHYVCTHASRCSMSASIGFGASRSTEYHLWHAGIAQGQQIRDCFKPTYVDS